MPKRDAATDINAAVEAHLKGATGDEPRFVPDPAGAEEFKDEKTVGFTPKQLSDAVAAGGISPEAALDAARRSRGRR